MTAVTYRVAKTFFLWGGGLNMLKLLYGFKYILEIIGRGAAENPAENSF